MLKQLDVHFQIIHARYSLDALLTSSQPTQHARPYLPSVQQMAPDASHQLLAQLIHLKHCVQVKIQIMLGNLATSGAKSCIWTVSG